MINYEGLICVDNSIVKYILCKLYFNSKEVARNINESLIMSMVESGCYMSMELSH